MGCQSKVTLGNNLTFTITTHDPDTGALTDADSDPIYRIYEDETATPILTGTMDKLDDAGTTGFYSELIACTTGNGFDVGKSYNIYIQATVDSDTGGISYGFVVEAAVADEVWDEARSGHTDSGSFGETLDATVASRSSHTPAEVWTAGTRTLTANDNLNDPTAAAVADAVWDEASSGHTDAGKAGAQVWTDIDAILDDTGSAGVVIADDAIDADSVAAAGANKIADHTIRRSFQNACDSSDGDTKSFRSILGAIAKLVNKVAISGSTLTIYEDDDSTALGSQTITTDSGADPISELDTA
jgi:hypothetical protein